MELGLCKPPCQKPEHHGGLPCAVRGPVAFHASVSSFPAFACRDLRLVSTLPPVWGVDLCGWSRREPWGQRRKCFCPFRKSTDGRDLGDKELQVLFDLGTNLRLRAVLVVSCR